MTACPCQRLGEAKQLFRIRHPKRYFEQVATLDPLPAESIGGRWIWRCLGCEQCFALLRLPFKDEEDILVRGDGREWIEWDWRAMAATAEHCRWSGTDEGKYVL